MEKNFRAQNRFIHFLKFWKYQRKINVIFRTKSGKKICKVKFSKEEFILIEQAAKFNNQTLDQFFHDLLEELIAKYK